MAFHIGRDTRLALLVSAPAGAHTGLIPPMPGFLAFLLSFAIAILALLFGLIGLLAPRRRSAGPGGPRPSPASCSACWSLSFRRLEESRPCAHAAGRFPGSMGNTARRSEASQWVTQGDDLASEGWLSAQERCSIQ